MEYTHNDLWDNFVSLTTDNNYNSTNNITLKAPKVSFDMIENDWDPSRNNPWHGTSCAGIIGAVKNKFCGMGIAYEVNLGGQLLFYCC